MNRSSKPGQLAAIIVDWSTAKSPILIGLAGLPGSGKTTLAALLVKEIKKISDKEALAISLDDFYLTPAERKDRGLRWRAVPGSHDLQLLAEFLNTINSETKTIEVPRYDTRSEVRLAPVVQSRPDIVIFDGWLIGARACGYELLEDAFDRLIFIDMDLEVAHQSRLNREALIRKASNGVLGMSAANTELFWNEALLPIGRTCSATLRQTADILIEIDATYTLTNLSFPTLALPPGGSKG